MKANELRIGNCARSYGVITKISFSDFAVFELYERREEEPPYEGIPITEEWLLKFGFEKRELNFGVIKQYSINCTPPKYRNKYAIYFRFGEIRDELFKMYWYASDPINTSMHSFPCKYVHQLQNLYFALTGEELEIKS